MNILLIDRALPSSIYSGKTVRLKNIYGRLAQEMKVVYLRTTQPGEEEESEELEFWAHQVFYKCLRMPLLGTPTLMTRINSVAAFRPWYDIFAKHKQEVGEVKKKLEEIVKQFEIDVVFTFDIEVAQYGLLLSEICPWIQDLGDSMSLQIKRQMKNASELSKKLKLSWRFFRENKFEREMVRKTSSTIFVAEDDASMYRDEAEVSIDVIPNGVDTDYFDPSKVQPIRGTNPYLIFSGHMSFVPNQDTAVFFAKNIFPIVRKQLPNVHFKIVGANPSHAVLELQKIEGVEVTGSVPDIRPYLAGASAFVCPMRIGCGIKNKLLEAMAMKLPIVSSELAIRGISNLPPDLITIASNPKVFAEHVIRILQNPGLYHEAAEQTREFVMKSYSWHQVVNQYKKLLDSIGVSKLQK